MVIVSQYTGPFTLPIRYGSWKLASDARWVEEPSGFHSVCPDCLHSEVPHEVLAIHCLLGQDWPKEAPRRRTKSEEPVSTKIGNVT